MEAKPIPSFYCCYLLRSQVRHSSLYIGSTPDIVRRISQHNGLKSGGAKKTSRQSLQPWEVLCIVHGFPSRIAALQFERAWQETNTSRHVSADDKRKLGTSGSLTATMARLHTLLRAPGFSLWPLTVRMLSPSPWKAWKTWDEREVGDVRPGIKVSLNLDLAPQKDSAVKNVQEAQEQVAANIKALDTTYNAIKEYVGKGQSLFQNQKHVCSICTIEINPDYQHVLLCPKLNCDATSHLSCLASSFLHIESRKAAILPTGGVCSSCHQITPWGDYMRELSLRLRGKKELDRLLNSCHKKIAIAGADGRREEIEEGEYVNQAQCDDDWIYREDEWEVIDAAIERPAVEICDAKAFQHPNFELESGIDTSNSILVIDRSEFEEEI